MSRDAEDADAAADGIETIALTESDGAHPVLQVSYPMGHSSWPERPTDDTYTLMTEGDTVFNSSKSPNSQTFKRKVRAPPSRPQQQRQAATMSVLATEEKNKTNKKKKKKKKSKNNNTNNNNNTNQPATH